MISAIERAERLIGTNGLRKLTDAGLIVEYHMSFPAGTRKVIREEYIEDRKGG